MSRKYSSHVSRRLLRGVIVTGAVIMTAGAGAAAAEGLTPAHSTAVHTVAGATPLLTGEDDLGWQ
ncbi:hypothetical protein [Streptomyces sp. NPDC001492]